ncbi:MAG: L-2-amino-thiazoline-4-carboxylic acid hydrolase [Synergistaceae bacterium]|jgi:hypothetical protein|nr:L-2-amino-thiazoline-4-carboxylic acid hydrolase [Synergistaceae bacterium]
MYNITEIKDQNQQDCLSLLYLHLAGSLAECCGRSAAGTVREAIRRMGRDMGSSLRKKHVAAGVKTNLRSLYGVGLEYRTDPRMYEEVLADSEEVCLWEVRTCPMADLWNRAGAGEIGLWYCEEFQRGLVTGYTGGRGQMNQSTFLTCRRDNHCRFSAYLRAANLDGEQRRESFPFPGEETGPSAPPLKDATFAEGIGLQFIKMYGCLLEAARERHGDEGVCAVALGLRRLAGEVTPLMKLHAAHTREVCDEAFLRLNFPIAPDVSQDPRWLDCVDPDAPRLMQINLLNALKTELLRR